MAKKTYPHEDLIISKKIKVTELSAEAQTAITAFRAETDETKKVELDETIYGLVQDHIEANPPADAADDKNKKPVTKPKDGKDVSSAPTAKGNKAGKDEKDNDGKDKKDNDDKKEEKGPPIMGYNW